MHTRVWSEQICSLWQSKLRTLLCFLLALDKGWTLIWYKSKSTFHTVIFIFYGMYLFMQGLSTAWLFTLACWLMNILCFDTVCLFSWGKYGRHNLLFIFNNLWLVVHAEVVTISISIAHTYLNITFWHVIHTPKCVLQIWMIPEIMWHVEERCAVSFLLGRALSGPE